MLTLGAGSIVWVPLANIFGRRPITLLGVLLMTICCAWAGTATSYESLLAARVLSGLGGAPSDTIAPDMVGEVWFRHQQGRVMVSFTIFANKKEFKKMGNFVSGWRNRLLTW